LSPSREGFGAPKFKVNENKMNFLSNNREDTQSSIEENLFLNIRNKEEKKEKEIQKLNPRTN
jgi:hypothetical protein